jgi:hypothetical protein
MDHAGMPVMLLRHSHGKMRRDGFRAAWMQPDFAVDERGRLHSAPGLVHVVVSRGQACIRGPCRNRGDHRQWVRNCKTPDRLRRQDEAGFPASGTSFLSICLHIVLGRAPTFRREERAALFPIILLFQCSESRRQRHAENRRWPDLRRRRYFHAASRGLHFWSCAITFDFQSSSDGAQRRRLSHPSRQGPRSWWRADNRAPNRRGAWTPDQLRR